MKQLEEILNIVDVEVPPLQSTVPLSYRSGDSVNANNLSSVQTTATPFEGFVVTGQSLDQEAGLV